RLVRGRSVRRVRTRLRAPRERWRSARRLHVRRRARQHPHAVRPVPSAALRARRAGPRARHRERAQDAGRGAPGRLRADRPRGEGLVMSTEAFDAVDVIVAKRDGKRLSDGQIDWVIDAYTRGVVAEEQMSALNMAILLNGMDRAEISRWTAAMIASGERMDFSALTRPTADKHSTGGVGDKITLPLAPLVAVFDVAVPQLSGRGLGHTGGTLDKLES